MVAESCGAACLSCGPIANRPFSWCCATARLAASRRLGSPNKGAHEFSVRLRGQYVSVETLICEKRAGVFSPVNAGRLDADAAEARCLQLSLILGLVQCTR